MKILIANRGEIAIRIMRACRELEFRTIAVYSQPDRVAPHVRYADEAYLLGPGEPSQSYLAIDRIIDVALKAGAEAVHPCLLYTSPSPRDRTRSRMPSSA